MKGISPVIATLILIIVAIVAGIATYAYVTGYVASSAIGSPPSAITIDAVEDPSSDLTLYVRNIGEAQANITAVYVLQDGTLVNHVTTSITIDPGSSATIDTDLALSAGTYLIKVVTADGGSAAISIRVG